MISKSNLLISVSDAFDWLSSFVGTEYLSRQKEVWGSSSLQEVSKVELKDIWLL